MSTKHQKSTSRLHDKTSARILGELTNQPKTAKISLKKMVQKIFQKFLSEIVEYR